jgi:hypothetical protein
MIGIEEEEDMAYWQVLLRHLHGKDEEKYENITRNSPSLGRIPASVGYRPSAILLVQSASRIQAGLGTLIETFSAIYLRAALF